MTFDLPVDRLFDRRTSVLANAIHDTFHTIMNDNHFNIIGRAYTTASACAVVFSLAHLSLFATGCGDDSPETIDAGNPEDGGTSDDAGGPITVPGGPRILDFSVNARTIDDAQTATFTAIVTDPDGIDDVIGGSLKAPSGASYGAFSTASSEGSYQISLEWDAINAVEELSFPDSDSTSREFVAEFYDQLGHMATATISITFECSTDGARACEDGVCDPLTGYDDCGSCGNSCGSFWEETLAGSEIRGVIVPYGFDIGCVSERRCYGELRLETNGTFTNDRSCDDACGTWTCIDASVGYTTIDCSTTVESISGGEYANIDCSCLAP